MEVPTYGAIVAILAIGFGSLLIWPVMKCQFRAKQRTDRVKVAPDGLGKSTQTALGQITSTEDFCRLVLNEPLHSGATNSFVIAEGTRSFRDVVMVVTDLARLDSYVNPEYVTTHGFFERKKRYKFGIVGHSDSPTVEGFTLPASINNRIRLMIDFLAENRRFNQRIQIDTSQVPWRTAQRVQRIRSDGSAVTLYELVDHGFPLDYDNMIDWN